MSDVATSAVRALPSSQGGYDRVPPHNLDAETSVIGAMLLSKDAIAEVSETVQAEDFYRGAHRTMFEAIHELYDRGEPVDAVTLAEELKRRGRLDDVGGTVGIADILNRVPTAANALYYGKIVAQHALRRGLIDAGTEITKLGYADGEDVQHSVDAAESLVYRLSQYGRVSEFTSMKQLISQGFELIERLHESNSAVTGLATGFTDLDELTAGLQPSNLVILAARPSMGKSTLAVNMASNVAVEQRKPVVLFSLEMSQMELVQRILAAEARVDSDRLRTGRLRETDWPKLSRAMGKLAEAPFYIDDTPGITLMEIRSKARRLKQQHGLDLLIVDYLQLMQAHRRHESRVQEVSELSRGLKILAKELDIPILALSQLSRRPEDRTDRRPQLADLRESGCLTAGVRILRADTGAETTLGELHASGERNIPVWTVDDRSRIVRGTMTHVFSNGYKPVFRMRLASGREIEATGNHPFMTPRGWTRLDALRVGTSLAVPRTIPEPEAADAWPEERVALLARLIGSGGAAPRLPWLDDLGISGRRRHELFIPAAVFTLKLPQVRLFLRHVWAAGRRVAGRDGMGSLGHATSSRRLADDLQLLLIRWGIHSRIRRVRREGHPESYRVWISGRDSRLRFLQEIAVHRADDEQVASRDVAAAEVHWDRVAEITYLRWQEVFDATVPGTHNFVANNIVVSNSIEQDADIVCFIYRDEVYNPDTDAKGEAELIVAKHRNGPLKTVPLAFLGTTSRFASMRRAAPGQGSMAAPGPPQPPPPDPGAPL